MKAAITQEFIDLDFKRDLFCILGMPIDVIDMEGALSKVAFSAAEGTPCFLSTPNLNFFIQSLRDESFTHSIIESDLSVADGYPICWLARILDIPVTERVAGSSMFEELIARKTENPIKVFFFGGQEDVAEQAMREVNNNSNGVRCVGALNPGMGSVEEMSSHEILEEINQSSADFVVVSLGAKKGQNWILHNRHLLDAPILSHLGAVVNFAAGKVSRAPKLAQSLRLEWLWRISEEPHLWKRYMSDGTSFLTILLFRVVPHIWFKKRLNKSGATSQPFQISIQHNSSFTEINFTGSATKSALIPHRKSLAKIAAGDDMPLKLNLQSVTYIDESTLGLLALLDKHLPNRFSISTPSSACRKILKFNRMEHLIEKD